MQRRQKTAQKCVGNRFPVVLSAAIVTLVGGLAGPGVLHAERDSAIPQDPSRYRIVDCLLPGQVRKLGGQMTYLSPRRPIKTTQSDCEIRGGEYVAYDRANYETALAVWMPTAEGGDAQAQTYVGEIYERGLGRPVDYAEAARWYRKAADQNYSRAQLNLAYLYEQGLGVAKDPLQALNLYRQGAGITDDSLTYVSEVTAVRTGMQAEIDSLTAQLEQQNSEVDRLKSELDANQTQLGSQRAALARAQGEARGLREEVARLQASTGADPAKAQELQRLENELRAREQRVLQDERAVAQLEAETAGQRSRLADQLKSAAEKDLAMREQLQQATEARDELQQKLVQTQRKLLDTEQQAARLRVDLTNERARIASERDQLAKQSTGGDQAQRQAMAAALAERERKLGSQQAQIDQLLAQQRTYTAELSKLRAEQQARARTVATQQGELAATQDRLAQTEKRVADLTAQLEAERARVATDRQQLSKQASTTSAAEQAQRQKLAADLSAREQKIAEQQKVIDTLRAQQRADSAELARLRSEQQAQGALLAKQQAGQQAEVASVRSELASTKRRLAETQQRVNDLTAQLEAEQARIASEREQLNRRASSAVGAQQAEIARLRQDLQARETDLKKQSGLIAQLEQESRIYQAQIKRLQDMPVVQVATRSAAVAPVAAPAAVQMKSIPRELQNRRYYALIIGNNRYMSHPTLKTAVADAESIDQVLRARYGFTTKLLLNATSAQIGEAIDSYRKELQPDDSLLIYYAGHGQIDSDSGRGYWLPVDARTEVSQEWISDREIADWVDQIRARQVLVVADSCYSGVLTRDSMVGFKGNPNIDEQIRRLQLLAKQRSRTVLTSGTEDKPVPDTGPGGHSVFAKVFMEVLEANQGVLEGRVLYNQLFEQVRKRSPMTDQSPRYDAIRQAGHGVGDFLFVRRA